jgi:hypothetical protein
MAASLSALASALADRDPQRARALLRESLDHCAAGNGTSGLVTQVTFIAAQLGDDREALQLAATAIPQLAWYENRPQLAATLNVVAWAVAETEPDAAGVLQGAARRLALADRPTQGTPQEQPATGVGSTSGTGGLISTLRQDATGRITNGIGEARLRGLRAQGEGMDTDSAVRCAPALIQRGLGRFNMND